MRLALFGLTLLGEEVEDVLLALGLAEQVGGVAVVHLVLVEGSHLHLHGVLPLLLLEGPHLLLELDPNGLGVGEGAGIRVVLLLVPLLLPLLISILEAVLMAASVVLLGASGGVGLVLVLVEVEVAAELGRLRLPQVRLGVYAAGSGLIEAAAGKDVGGIGVEGAVRCLSAPARPLQVQRLIECIAGEEQLVALDDEVGRGVAVIAQLRELLLGQQRDLLLLAVVEGEEGDLWLVAHPAAGRHEDLELFVVSDGEGVGGEFQFYPEGGELGDEEGEFVVELLEEELGAHVDYLVAVALVVGVDVVGEGVGHVLVHVVQVQVLLVDLHQFYEVVAVEQLPLLQHLALLLQQLLQRREVLDLLHPHALPLPASLVKRIPTPLHLQYRLDHQDNNFKSITTIATPSFIHPPKWPFNANANYPTIESDVFIWKFAAVLKVLQVAIFLEGGDRE